MTSDSNVNSANKRLPVMLSDAAFGESDRVEMCHMASTESSLGISTRAYPCAAFQGPGSGDSLRKLVATNSPYVRKQGSSRNGVTFNFYQECREVRGLLGMVRCGYGDRPDFWRREHLGDLLPYRPPPTSTAFRPSALRPSLYLSRARLCMEEIRRTTITTDLSK